MRDTILLLWRVRLRRSPARIVALVLLIALGGGVFLAVAAGARRTAAAYDEVADATDAAELGSSYVRDDLETLSALVETMPAVDAFTQVVGFQVSVADAPLGGMTSFAYYTDPLVVDRPIVLEGRLPRAADEAFVNEAGATGAGASVGEEIEIVIATPDFTEFTPETVTVVGIGAFADEVYEDETGAKPTLVLADEFVATHRDLIAWGALVVAVAPDAGGADVVAQMLDAGLTIDNDRRADRDRARAAIRPLALTLAVLALLAGLAMIIVVGLALRRLVRRTPAEARSLAAAGCSRRMLLAADMGVVLTVAVAGIVGALGVAVLASPLFPQGRARRIPALRGFDIDVTVLGFGALALLLALTALVAATSAAQPAELIQARDAIDVLVLAIIALQIGVMATVAHNLLSFVRERRRAFAVLKAMGFTRRQIRTTVLCQSGLVIAVALVFAVPLGIVAGRWLYSAFAGDIGVIVEPTVPFPALVVTVIAAVVLVQLVALVPAGRARRTNVTPALMPE